ncbi:hypothetical protein FXF52_22590 [Micromonospora sp. MP36]|nr:hypothetical protein FXF52_22590 [Micromonospora sp. MP36]
MDEGTGEVLSRAVLARRVDWCADLVAGMVSGLLAERWNADDVEVLASGVDAGGRKLPSNAWMALRRLGWTATAAEGVKVNDRVVRMAQEQAGRALRSAWWRAGLTGGVLLRQLCCLSAASERGSLGGKRPERGRGGPVTCCGAALRKGTTPVGGRRGSS